MALTYQESVEQTITAGEQIHQIVNGTATTEVTVEDGSKVPSIRKALLDNFYFKDPIAWQVGQTENVFNQLRQFTDGSWWYAPSATASNPISMGSTPVGDPLWRIYDFDAIKKLEPRIDEALRRSYAAAGYNVVGTFRDGFTIVNANDVGIDEVTGKGFTGPAGPVAAGTDPTSGGFVDRSNDILICLGSYAAIRSYSGSATKIYCMGRDHLLDGGAGYFILDPQDTTPVDNDGTVVGRFKRDFSGSVQSEWFGLRVGTVGDSTQKLKNFFGAISNSTASMAGESFMVTSLIDLDMSNCVISGVKGKTRIYGDFGYRVVEIGAVSDLSIQHMWFDNLYTNPVEDGYYSTVNSRNKNIRNLGFYGCKFSAPNCNGNGLTLYVNGLTTDAWQCDGLDVIGCEFTMIGRQACTLMNRSEVANKEKLFRRVRFNNNRGVKLGLSGNYGMLVSFDGYGSDFECNFNYVEDALNIGIENTHWSDGSISHNQFAQGSLNSRFQPFACEGFNVDVIGNKCVTPVRDQSYFAGSRGSKFRDNYLELAADALAPRCMLIRNSSEIIGGGNTYINSGSLANASCITIDSTTGTSEYINLSDETFNLNTLSGQSCVTFSGASTTKNKVSGKFKRLSGDYGRNLASAFGNVISGDTVGNLGGLDYTLFTMPDSNVTADVGLYSASFIIINGTTTAQRSITMPRVVKAYTIRNNTPFPLQITTGTSSAIVIPSNKSVGIYCDGGGFNRATAEF
jgi:hypothetical protein